MKNKIWIYKFFALFLIVVGMILFWIIKLPNTQIFQEQIIESEKRGAFTADVESLRAISLCVDDKNTFSVIQKNGSGVIKLYNDLGECIWVDNVKLSMFGSEQFGRKINLDSKNIVLEKQTNYKIKLFVDNQEYSGLSVCIYGKQISFFPIYISICVSSILGFCIVNLLYDFKKISFGCMFFLMILIMGMAYNFIMPTLCTPDEGVHFSQVYAYASNVLGEKARADSYVIIHESGIKRLAGSLNIQDSYSFWTNWKYGNLRNNTASDKFVAGNMVPFYTYLPATIALFVARLFNFPYQIVFLSGRIANLVFFGLICLLAMKIYNPMRKVIAAIAFLPSTIWLVASYSYDGWNLAFCMLFVCLCLKIREQECGIRIRDLLSLILILLLFAPIKYIYITIALTVFLIPLKQWKKKYLLWGCVVSITIFSCAMVVSRGSEIISYLTSSNMDVRGRLSDGSSRHYTVGWVIHNPVYVLQVCYKTFIQYSERYITKSMVGEFYDIYVPTFLIVFISITFLLIMITNSETKKIYLECKNKAMIICVLGCAAVYGAFLFIYSNIAQPQIGVIEGMQGRYFLPFYIFIPIIVYSEKTSKYLKKERNVYGSKDADIQDLLLKIMIFFDFWILFCKFIGIIQN